MNGISNSNISTIKRVNENITFFNDGNNIPDDKVIIKNKTDIINRMLLDYILGVLSTYALDNASDLIKDAYLKLDAKYNIKDIISLDEKKVILKIIRNEYSIRELEDISWLLEDVRIYMWVLGLLEKPTFDKECDIKEINGVIESITSYNELTSKSFLVSKEEIIEYFNLVIKNRSHVHKMNVNSLVVQEQLDALSFVTSYDVVEDIKTLITVNYNNKDLNFDFNICEGLLFNKISNNKKELFTISSEDKRIKMILFDFGHFEGDFESKVEKYNSLFISKGFKVINKWTLSSHNLNNKIYQLLVTKDNIVLNSYLFTISNHILRLDSLVDSSIDYNNYNNLVNSRNSNVDMDLLFSIKESDYASADEVLNEYDYSNIVPTKSNINDIIKHLEEIYNEILKNKRSGKLEFNILIDSVYNQEIECSSYKEYMEYEEIGYLNKVNKLVISLIINNININTKSYNTFELSFEPYNIKFTRKSNKKENNMDQVEEYIKTMLKKINVQNTIFLTK